MTADAFLQLLTQTLFVVIALIVGATAIRRPTRVAIHSGLLFGTLALVIAASWLMVVLGDDASPVLPALRASLFMALPFLLLRLADDFADVPRPILTASGVGLALAAGGLFLVQPLPLWLTLLYVLSFVTVTTYATAIFIRTARRSVGVTQRRMQAVAVGTLGLGLIILIAGLNAALPALADWWTVLSRLSGLVTGVAYFVGFTPPSLLRRAWQEPELRAFLSQAARLPHLPDTPAVIAELERGAATAVGVPYAAIGLWDETSGVLRFAAAGTRVEIAPGTFIAGRAFAEQRIIFAPDAPRLDPEHAELYAISGAKAMVAAPITAGHKRLGVLTVYAARAPIFADDDINLIRLLADQAAVILDSRALIDEATHMRAREEAMRLKDDFLSAAAHDLKTPLTTLVAQAQWLERRANRDPTAPVDPQAIRRIAREAGRLRALVHDLLDASRIERGQLVGARELVDLTQIAHEICDRYATARHPCVVVADAPAIGEYDRIRIAQLIENLVDNAVKYSPRGGEVRIELRPAGSEYHLAVTDHGIGMPSTDLPNLFSRFHRGSNVDDRRFAGMGLGLYICHAIVTQHGGRIWATSPGPGHGSTFHVALPASAAPVVTLRTAASLEDLVAFTSPQAEATRYE